MRVQELLRKYTAQVSKEKEAKQQQLEKDHGIAKEKWQKDLVRQIDEKHPRLIEGEGGKIHSIIILNRSKSVHLASYLGN